MTNTELIIIGLLVFAALIILANRGFENNQGPAATGLYLKTWSSENALQVK